MRPAGNDQFPDRHGPEGACFLGGSLFLRGFLPGGGFFRSRLTAATEDGEVRHAATEVMHEETGIVQMEFRDGDLAADGVQPASRRIQAMEREQRIGLLAAALVGETRNGRDLARVRKFVVGVGNGHVVQHQADLGEMRDDGTGHPAHLQLSVHIVGRIFTDQAREGTGL